MFEPISSDVLDSVTGGQETQTNNGGQSCKALINWGSCNNTQRDERTYVAPLPSGEPT